MDGYPKTYEQAKELFAGKVYAAWSGSGREGGGHDPAFSLLFNVNPTPRTCFHRFRGSRQKTYRLFKKTNFATKANKCKI